MATSPVISGSAPVRLTTGGVPDAMNSTAAARTPCTARHHGHPGARPAVAYAVTVPRYEYRCRACGATFEQTRPMSESADPCRCPGGHDDTVKLLSTVAVGGRASAGRDSAGPASRGGGGCCGGSCGCG